MSEEIEKMLDVWLEAVLDGIIGEESPCCCVCSKNSCSSDEDLRGGASVDRSDAVAVVLDAPAPHFRAPNHA